MIIQLKVNEVDENNNPIQNTYTYTNAVNLELQQGIVNVVHLPSFNQLVKASFPVQSIVDIDAWHYDAIGGGQ